MDMNVNLAGGGAVRWGGQTDAAGAAQAASAAQQPLDATDLTITQKDAAAVSALDAVEVPDVELAKDDALGKLVSAAFSAPPPPPPSWQTA